MGCTCCGEKGLIVAGFFIGCIACLHAAPEWACTSITDNASTPLANDCRRSMAEYFDYPAGFAERGAR